MNRGGRGSSFIVGHGTPSAFAQRVMLELTEIPPETPHPSPSPQPGPEPAPAPQRDPEPPGVPTPNPPPNPHPDPRRGPEALIVRPPAVDRAAAQR
jgi:outer membrane biosynthesis protein TonB